MVRLIEATELAVEPGFAERAPGSMPSRIEVTFDDGSDAVRECLFHPGHSFPDRGLSPDAVCRKYDQIAGPHIGDSARHALREVLLGFEDYNTVDIMTRLRTLG